MPWINAEIVICQSVAPGIAAVDQERGHGTSPVQGARLAGEEPEGVIFSSVCWNRDAHGYRV